MTRREAIRFVLLRSLGNFLVLFSLYGVVATFGPVLYQEVKFRVLEARGVRFEVANVPQVSRVPNVSKATKETTKETPSVSFADILAGNKEQILIPHNTQFSITIPKLGTSARIYPNVDPGDEKAFLPVLEKGIAHAKGSVFPGMKGNIYLFAHSTDNWWHVGRYNAVFYLLKDLSEGDEIIVFFEDVRYDYIVTKKIITPPTDVSFLTNDQMSPEQLVLQTCWPPGTTLQRLYVTASPKRDFELFLSSLSTN